MRHGSRPLAALSLALLGLGAGQPAPLAATEAAVDAPAKMAGPAPLAMPAPSAERMDAAKPATTVVSATVTDLRNNNGVVRACLTDNAKKFPECTDEGHTYRVAAKAGPSVTFTFKNVAPGRYAISLIHDENENDRMDRKLLVMPKEGYGFSRDAKVVMGPPSFKSAAFDVGNEPVRQTIRMRYMF